MLIYFNSSAFSCGGNLIGGPATNQCWKYHSHHHESGWLPEDDLLTSRSNAAAVTINDGVSKDSDQVRVLEKPELLHCIF